MTMACRGKTTQTAQEYLAEIEKTTARIIGDADSRILTESDAEALREAVDEMKYAFSTLDWLFVNPATGNKRDAGYLFLAKLISASIATGSLAQVSEPSQRYALFKGNKKRADKKRPGARSHYQAFIGNRLRQNIDASAEEVERAFKDDDSGNFEVDGGVIYARLLTKKTMKIETLPKTISKVRKKILEGSYR